MSLFKKLFIKSIFSLNELSILSISISSKALELLLGRNFLLSKFKISTAVCNDQLVLILLKFILKLSSLLESYSRSIIPPSIGYSDELTKNDLLSRVKSNNELANFIFLYLPKLQAKRPSK